MISVHVRFFFCLQVERGAPFKSVPTRWFRAFLWIFNVFMRLHGAKSLSVGCYPKIHNIFHGLQLLNITFSSESHFPESQHRSKVKYRFFFHTFLRLYMLTSQKIRFREIRFKQQICILFVYNFGIRSFHLKRYLPRLGGRSRFSASLHWTLPSYVLAWRISRNVYLTHLT